MNWPHALRRGSAWWTLAFALLVCLLYTAADGFALFRMGHYQLARQDVGRPLFNAFAYASTYASALIALVLLHGHGRRWLRYGSFAIAAASLAVFGGFAAFNGRGFTITEASLFWSELEFVPGALRFFFWDYAPALILAVLAAGLLEWIVRTRLRAFESLWILAAPILAALLCYGVVLRTDSKVDQFPIPFRVPVLTAYAVAHQSVYLGSRDERYIEPSRSPLADHIVLIVDESIRGDLLSINEGPAAATPYLESIQQRILNYGVASSAANLSAPSNIVMQSGLRLDQLPDVELRSMKNPNLFAYMHAAGFRTFMINAQNALARPPNFMTAADIEAIDQYVQIRDADRDLARYESDRRIPELLTAIVTENERSFTYVLKMGAHFPYSSSYPPDRNWFQPDDSLDARSRKQAEVIASYMNALRFSVDEFLATLLPALEATHEDVLLVYTSDHGQSLYEDLPEGRSPVRGHGHHEAPPVQQAMIPLVLIPLGEGADVRFAERFEASARDRVSAFELFPSLLYLAGYDPAEIRDYYGTTIFDAHSTDTKRKFVSGNHFGADGPLYRDAPYRSSFSLNDFDEEAPPSSARTRDSAATNAR